MSPKVNATSHGARAVMLSSAAMHANNLRRDKDDAQRDDGLDRRLRHMDKAERRRREREAVRDREGGDGLDQFPSAAA